MLNQDPDLDKENRKPELHPESTGFEILEIKTLIYPITFCLPEECFCCAESFAIFNGCLKMQGSNSKNNIVNIGVELREVTLPP